MLQAGEMDRRIRIERKSTSAGSSGEEVDTWTEVDTVAAILVELRGYERAALRQLIGHAITTFQIRWSVVTATVTVKDRIVYGNRNFNITDVREIGRREGIALDCFAPSEEPVA